MQQLMLQTAGEAWQRMAGRHSGNPEQQAYLLCIHSRDKDVSSGTSIIADERLASADRSPT